MCAVLIRCEVSELTGLRIERLSTRVRHGVVNTLAGLVHVGLNSENRVGFSPLFGYMFRHL